MEESGEILQKFAAGEDAISMYLNDLESTLSERFEVGFFSLSVRNVSIVLCERL